MDDSRHPNRRILEETVRHLGPLADDMVFLGGCATTLLITDPAAASVRVTYDVDVLTEVASYLQYHALGDKLRSQGFREDPGDEQTAVICRWRHGPLVLDVMPTDEQVLSFGNRWYASAARAAMPFQLTSDCTIRLISPAYFLATKLEAIDGRPPLLTDVAAADPALRVFFKVPARRLSPARSALGGLNAPT